MKSHGLQLYGYHSWANRRLIGHLKELPPEAVHQEVQSAFPSIFSGLVHLYTVDHVWLFASSGLKQEDMREPVAQATQRTQGKSLQQLEVMFDELSEQYETFLNKLANLDTVVPYHHPRYGTLQASYTEIIQHVVNHGTYHRGNIAAMLRQLGHVGYPTDYVYYLYELQKNAE